MGEILSKIADGFIKGIRDVIDLTPPGKYMLNNRKSIIVTTLVIMYLVDFLGLDFLDKIKSYMTLFSILFVILYVN